MSDNNIYAGGNVVEWIRKKPLPTGWLCPRCGKVNAPDVKQCDCPPQLPYTIVGPTETK